MTEHLASSFENSQVLILILIMSRFGKRTSTSLILFCWIMASKAALDDAGAQVPVVNPVRSSHLGFSASYTLQFLSLM